MEVIPSINCMDRECVREHMARSAAFLPQDGWVHIDIADARFTFNRTWNEPKELVSMLQEHPSLNVEVHLMIEEPEVHVPLWLEAGARRVIVHREALDSPDAFDEIREACTKNKAELVLAASPETGAEDLLVYKDKVDRFLVLAVNPGPAGQGFQPFVIQKIKTLKAQAPDVIIEVDGGISDDTARRVKDAGAETVIAASYVFSKPDSALAYNRLCSIE